MSPREALHLGGPPGAELGDAIAEVGVEGGAREQAVDGGDRTREVLAGPEHERVIRRALKGFAAAR